MEQVLDKKQLDRDIYRLIIPSVLENMLQILAGVFTTAMVGRLLADEMAAQGISNRIYQTCFALFRGLGMGATVVCALHYGRGALGRCRRLIEQAFVTTVPMALALAAIIMIFPAQILSIFTNDPALIQMAVSYSRITAWAIPFMTAICFNTAAFNGQGDTKTPMFIAIVLNVINVCLGYTLIFGLGPIPRLGITGAAIATVVSQGMGAALGLWLLYRPAGPFGHIAREGRFFSLDMPELKAFYSAGVPAALEFLFWQFSAVVLSKVILSYSVNHYAAYQQGLQAEMLTEMPAMGFTVASTTLTAKSIGMRDGPLLRGYYWRMMKMSLIIAIIATLILFLLPNQIMLLLTDKPELIALGAVYVFIMGFAQIPQVLAKIFNGTIRASGGKRVPMYFSFIGIWIVRVPMAVICAWVLHLGIEYVWWAISLDQITRITLSMLYIWRKKVLYTVEQLPAENG